MVGLAGVLGLPANIQISTRLQIAVEGLANSWISPLRSPANSRAATWLQYCTAGPAKTPRVLTAQAGESLVPNGSLLGFTASICPDLDLFVPGILVAVVCGVGH